MSKDLDRARRLEREFWGDSLDSEIIASEFDTIRRETRAQCADELERLTPRGGPGGTELPQFVWTLLNFWRD